VNIVYRIILVNSL